MKLRDLVKKDGLALQSTSTTLAEDETPNSNGISEVVTGYDSVAQILEWFTALFSQVMERNRTVTLKDIKQAARENDVKTTLLL